MPKPVYVRSYENKKKLFDVPKWKKKDETYIKKQNVFMSSIYDKYMSGMYPGI